MKNRRDFLKTSALAAGTLALYGIGSKVAFASENNEDNLFKLPDLEYGFEALEPYIDTLTMEIHYTKHHQGYVNNLNKAVVAEKLQGVSLNELLGKVSKHSAAIRNNAGGHYNHSFFWRLMRPGGSKTPTNALAEAITKDFGNIDNLQKVFSDAAKNRFGSGWAWLIKSTDGKLSVTSTPNQDNTLMDIAEVKGTPILGIDVWEHAYYLHYQNKRADYVNAWWNLINWDVVLENYNA